MSFSDEFRKAVEETRVRIERTRNQHYCPKCGEGWSGEYDLDHRCDDCGGPLHVRTEEEMDLRGNPEGKVS